MEIYKCLKFDQSDKLEYFDFQNAAGEHFDQLCDLLADYIIEKYENQVVYKIVFKNMELFSKTEKKEIFHQVIKRLSEDRENRKCRKELIREQLLEYFQKEKTIVINGFVMFRLGFYFMHLENLILQEIDQYLVQKDYDEFLDLIKYFIDISSAKRQTVEIYFDGETYRLYDENKSDITDLFVDDILETCYSRTDYDKTSVTADDLLLSSLISIAPQKIIFHNASRLSNQELLQTINKVFYKRVQYMDI